MFLYFLVTNKVEGEWRMKNEGFGTVSLVVNYMQRETEQRNSGRRRPKGAAVLFGFLSWVEAGRSGL